MLDREEQYDQLQISVTNAIDNSKERRVIRGPANDPFVWGAESQTHENSKVVKKLLIAIALCFLFMIAELVGGYLSGSLAIMTDAAHLLSDVAGFLVSLCAVGWSRKRASAAMSYGYHRAEILGALLSISMVWALTGWLVVEAFDRLRNPQPIDGRMMFWVAILGVLVNAVIGLVLHEQQHHHGIDDDTAENLERIDASLPSASHTHAIRGNLNVRAAFIHAIGDLIQSLGVLVAAIVVWWRPEWRAADPICTFLFSILVVASTWFLARDTIIILMEGTPKDVCTATIQQQLAAIDGVREVHDLHVWALAPGKAAATVHIVADWSTICEDPSTYEELLIKCQRIICRQGVHHVTIQVDPDQRVAVHCRVDCCGSEENFLSNNQLNL